MEQWNPGYEVVDGLGHVCVVKPGMAEDTSFLIAEKFLLNDGLCTVLVASARAGWRWNFAFPEGAIVMQITRPHYGPVTPCVASLPD